MEAERIAEHYLDGAQRAVKSRVEFTSRLTFFNARLRRSPAAFVRRSDVAAQQRGAATSFPRQDGREVFVVGKGAAAAKTHGGEVFATGWWSGKNPCSQSNAPERVSMFVP